MLSYNYFLLLTFRSFSLSYFSLPLPTPYLRSLVLVKLFLELLRQRDLLGRLPMEGPQNIELQQKRQLLLRAYVIPP